MCLRMPLKHKPIITFFLGHQSIGSPFFLGYLNPIKLENALGPPLPVTQKWQIPECRVDDEDASTAQSCGKERRRGGSSVPLLHFKI